jgi:hypothetical protein
MPDSGGFAEVAHEAPGKSVRIAAEPNLDVVAAT